ncbi:glycoside hydrolase family 10 protein [Saccharopolyspora sp. 5N708]|uniref:glycoside hydrolase family 10 protein n=1 Tax=Saccharopolyspora sp. 5N708 TaxID=3457424 RepID=UPI003FD23943
MTRTQGLRRIRADVLGLALASVAILLGIFGTTGAAAKAPTTAMRGVWIAGVDNIDWPSKPGLSPQQQQDEYRRLLDEAVANKLNAVFVQVRPTADAFWPSPYEPWSHWLTGQQGRDPGYDPLRFLVDETHQRGLQFHAWFNPYRVSMHDDPQALVPEHPARQHPEWTFAYGGKLYYNPGVPQARQFAIDAIMHAVANYPVDGVHLDDYFYPYPVEGQQIPDQQTFAEHGRGFDNIDDWRRDNVNRLVSELDTQVHQAKPGAEFGVSPFGIWRNAASDPAGSNTNGLESYSAIYADTRRWVREGWVDYIAPQVYWQLGHPVADYAALVPWWSQTVAGTDVALYIGQGAYRVGGEGWTDPGELSAHLTFNSKYRNVKGDIYFSAKSLTTNATQAMTRLVAEHYADY